MKKFNIVISQNALNDLIASKKYYNQQVDNLGIRFENEIFRILNIIENNPFIFPVKYLNIRVALALKFPYMIPYEIINDTILILSVYHTKREPNKK